MRSHEFMLSDGTDAHLHDRS